MAARAVLWQRSSRVVIEGQKDYWMDLAINRFTGRARQADRSGEGAGGLLIADCRSALVPQSRGTTDVTSS